MKNYSNNKKPKKHLIIRAFIFVFSFYYCMLIAQKIYPVVDDVIELDFTGVLLVLGVPIITTICLPKFPSIIVNTVLTIIKNIRSIGKYKNLSEVEECKFEHKKKDDPKSFCPGSAIPDDVKDSCSYLGTDLVELVNSGPCCEFCAKYRSRIYTLTGKDRRFPRYPSDYRPGCCLSIYPFILGVNEPSFHCKDIIKFSNRPFVDDRTTEEIKQYEEWRSIVDKKTCAYHQVDRPKPLEETKTPMTLAKIDFDRIIQEENDWRREQQGLKPIEYELQQIDRMDGHAFEYWCADLLRKSGFVDVEVTPGSRDQGVDIIAIKDGVRYAIQCKCYSSDLGNTPVQEVHAGKAIYHCQVGAVMTNRYFTASAKEAAEATGTLLWDRDKLVEMLG